MSEETTNSGNGEAPAEAEAPEIAEVQQPQSGAPFPQDDYDKRVERIILKIRELEGTYATDKELNK